MNRLVQKKTAPNFFRFVRTLFCLTFKKFVFLILWSRQVFRLWLWDLWNLILFLALLSLSLSKSLEKLNVTWQKAVVYNIKHSTRKSWCYKLKCVCETTIKRFVLALSHQKKICFGFISPEKDLFSNTGELT